MTKAFEDTKNMRRIIRGFLPAIETEFRVDSPSVAHSRILMELGKIGNSQTTESLLLYFR